MKFSLSSVIFLVSCAIPSSSAWLPTQRSVLSSAQPAVVPSCLSSNDLVRHSKKKSFSLGSSASSEETKQAQQEEFSFPAIEYTEEELASIAELASQCEKAGDDKEELEKAILPTLSSMSPQLVIRLRQSVTHPTEQVAFVASSVESVMNARLETAKETLLSLLNAGEIRKLDNLIGQAARSGRLDVAFFNVLTANLKEAMDNDDGSAAPERNEDGQPSEASRASILRHIYTRCQEEVEKTIPPGTAFLNKVLRTDQQAIRLNLYKHYLTISDEDGEGKNTITTPDGKTIELKNAAKPKALIALSEFVQAISDAVLQIRTLEKSGGIDRESGAQMVEACRQVAREARVVIGENYGVESDELNEFQEGLQPVFRPSSPESPYIQGQT